MMSRSRFTVAGALAAAAALSAPAANAADVLTSAAVTGPSGTVWNTTVDGFYALFLQTPGLGDFLNPGDEPLSFATSNGQNRFLLAGDGWTPGTNGDSDPFYNILLTFGSGNTLSGTYTPTTNTFIGGSSYTLGGLTYTLEEFSFRRTLGDAVSQTVATPGGDGNDYSGNFRVSALTAVPEPATWALMILGFGAVGGAMRRRTVRIATRPA